MAKKVLLCDDEIHILRAAEIKISRAGYDVRIAHDGMQAWEAIQQDLPDMLVTDLQMPRATGLELAELVRGNAATRHLPIVLLTAKGFELPKQEILARFGLIEILAKPFSPRELLGLVEKTLGPVPVQAH